MRSKKGSALIAFIVILVIVCIVLGLLTKLAWFLTVAPVIRNIIPFLIGTGVGFWFGRSSKN
jgi:hypothetical protein